MASPFATINAASPPVYRGGPSQPQPPVKLSLQSLSASWAWGSDGAEASMVYDYSGVPVTVGQNLQIVAAGHIFNGVCTASAPLLSSSGNKWELKFKDNLYYLDYDWAFCAFNKLDDHIVNGRRVKRYVHYLPDLEDAVTLIPAAWQIAGGQSNIQMTIGGQPLALDGNGNTVVPVGIYFGGLIKAYTNAPLTAAQMIVLMLNSIWTLDEWATNFHPDQFIYPVFDIDCTGGKKLKAVFQEISDQQGLVFAQTGAPFNLTWIRKGQPDSRWPADLPILPPLEINPATGQEQLLTDDRSEGEALSSNPTQVRVMGDRNVYMLLNCPLVPGWSPGWEQFYDRNLFVEKCYQIGVTSQVQVVAGTSFPAGTAFSTIGSSAADPEAIVAKQLALVYALSITVGQFAELVGETLFEDAPNFADYLKYADKSRLDMPAALYIDQILFRAFQFPDGFEITNQYGVKIPLDSLECLDKQIARITFDNNTGEMTADPTKAADGNGLAIVKGYQVGQDLFSRINPSRFDLKSWNNAQDIWATQNFTIDDNGEPGGKTVLFDQPIIASASLVKIINGYGVLNAAPLKSDGVTPGFDIPQVQVGISFSGERYSWLSTPNPGGRLETMQIGGLNKELIGTYGELGFQEVLYSDGLSADQKAIQYVTPLQLLQYVYDNGGYRHVLLGANSGMQLTPFIDRIQVTVGPDQPAQEVIDYTNELPRQVFTPERDLDRNVKLLTLLPGQQQLRAERETDKVIAQALAQSADARLTITDAFNILNDATDLSSVTTIGTNESTVAVGTPLFGGPLSTSSAGLKTGTMAVQPIAVTKQNNVFMGAVARDQETVGKARSINVARTGSPLMRVLPPVKAGDAVGQVSGKDYLSNLATDNLVGTAQESATVPTTIALGGDGIVALIPVLIGASTPTAGPEGNPFEIIKVSETQVQISNQSCLLNGLDAQTQTPVFGLGQPFDVDQNSKIYLEVLFDLNGNPIMANVCVSDAGWRPQVAAGFPLLSGLVDNTQLSVEADNLKLEFGFHVSDLDMLATAQAALALFKNLTPRYNQFYAYVMIGFCTPSTNGAEGLSLAGNDSPMTVVQCLTDNLMLQGFCQAGTPCLIPMPYAGPFATTLPAVTFKLLAEVNQATEVTLACPDYPGAQISYTLDGAAAQQYSGTFEVSATGSHTIIAWATAAGYIQSPSATQTFTV